MTLQERLAAAAEARRRAAGLPPEADTEGNSAGEPTATVDLTSPLAPVIDLRPAEERRFSKALTVAWRSDVCPTCGGQPRLDMEDIVGGVDHYSCLACGQLFQVPR
jgi:hypothetical protein